MKALASKGKEDMHIDIDPNFHSHLRDGIYIRHSDADCGWCHIEKAKMTVDDRIVWDSAWDEERSLDVIFERREKMREAFEILDSAGGAGEALAEKVLEYINELTADLRWIIDDSQER